LKKRVPFEASMFDSFRGYKAADLNQKFSRLKKPAPFLDLLKKLLQYLPERRLSAA
jgi:hypothetical protein